jgi:hypothetical protein
MGTRHSPRPSPAIETKASALVAEAAYAGEKALQARERSKIARSANLDADVEKNVEAFIRALARQTARKLAAEYLASCNAK